MSSELQSLEATTSLWDWRRAIFEAYREVREQADHPQAAWAKWRKVRSDLFRNHAQSPIARDGRTSYDGPPFYSYDKRFRFAVDLTAPLDDEAINVPAGADGTVSLKPFARTSGLKNVLGGELTLFWMQLYGGGVFLPFQDATSNSATYGGGRYLLDTIKGADLGSDSAGRVILDFN
ncbi:MAG: DUF1684 domain-containing protein, partial [Pseudomonadota bacterium]